MEINGKKLDELYKEWSGEHHTTNSNKSVHDSAECTDFAEYCLKWAVSEGEMIPTRDSNCNIPLVSNRRELLSNFAYYVSKKYVLNIDIDDSDVDEFIKIAL